MTLFQKLFLAVLVCVAVALATLVVVSRISIDSGLAQLIARQDERQAGRLVSRLQEYYARFGSWSALPEQRRLWTQVLRARWLEEVRPPPFARRVDAIEERRGISLYRRAYLLDAQQTFVAGARDRQTPRDTLLAIEHNGSTVGWLGFSPATLPVRLPEERALAASQNRALLIAAGATLLLAALAAWLLARGIARPVAHIGHTVGRLAEGEFESRSEIKGSAEIRQLARDVNGLAAALDRNQRLRHEWMTEIAHELRTPVTVLRGEIEAVRDGVRTADERTLGSLYEEISHLTKLLDDLQELALSDAGALTYRFESIDFSALVEELLKEYGAPLERAEIALQRQITPGLRLQGDPSRLRQLLHNLLRNSLRYTDPGGALQVKLSRENANQVVLTLNDSAPGVTTEDLERLFERFYRVSASRHHGGSGLGLAISQRIVQAHGGQISAAASTLGGLAVTVQLPTGQETVHA